VAGNTSPIFALTPNLGSLAGARISTANTNRDGTGTLGTVCTGGTNGTRVSRVTVKGTVTTTAGMVRLFISDGTNTRLWKEIPVAAITASASVAAFEYILSSPDNEPLLVLPSTYTLKGGHAQRRGVRCHRSGGRLLSREQFPGVAGRAAVAEHGAEPGRASDRFERDHQHRRRPGRTCRAWWRCYGHHPATR
jgi:hypothetical protein